MNAIPFKVETSEKGTRFNRYYFHCVDCGEEFVTGRYSKNTKPYCIDCEKKYEREKAKERIRRKEADIRNQAIDDYFNELCKASESVRPVGWTARYCVVTIDKATEIAEQLKAKE